MDLMLLRVFQRELERQCRAALTATAEMQTALGLWQDQNRFWVAVQSFLVSCANISKALWGQGGKFEAERQGLRISLQVSDESPLRPTRFRNHFEHFDERLDEWWRTAPHHNIADHIVGPRGRTIVGLQDIEMFRQFDPSTQELIFWGDTYPLAAVIAEVQRLLPLAATEAAKPHWPPPEYPQPTAPAVAASDTFPPDDVAIPRSDQSEQSPTAQPGPNEAPDSQP